MRPPAFIVLSLVLGSGAAIAPVSSVYGVDSAVLLASNSSWEKFKRIRQGEATVEATAPGETPAANEPAPTAPRQAPATPVPGPPPQAAPLTTQPRSPEPRPTDIQVSAAATPTAQGGWWEFYAGRLDSGGSGNLDAPAGRAGWAYAISKPLPRAARIVVSLQDAGSARDAAPVFAPSSLGDIELRQQFPRLPADNAQPLAGVRIAAALGYLQQRYSLDVSERGIVLAGEGAGGASALMQALILPEPWRESVAYVSARGGNALPGLGAGTDSGRNPEGNSIDVSERFASDPLARAIHYRLHFSSDPSPRSGTPANAGLRWVNLLERHAIGGAFSWVKAGKGLYERGVRIPDLSRFEAPGQDVSPNRPHPAITRSTGNFPLTAMDRLDTQRFPRGHYNMGVSWNLAGIVDTQHELVFPLKYQRRTNLGGGVPDQPARITVSVTPRRARSFQLENGDTLQWSWDAGALSGSVVVEGDSVTIDGIPLVSGEGYKLLRLQR
tara:strand:+ start:19803 stop:21293 length:1491 start_codon:yes stop_codon:yes gene_type:complete